jgi:RNA polymerase sigma factor (sigma-70 family)
MGSGMTPELHMSDEELYNKYVRMAWGLARRYKPLAKAHYSPLELEDLVSAGMAKLFEKKDSYEHRDSASFTTWAWHTIRGGITQEIYRTAWRKTRTPSRGYSLESYWDDLHTVHEDDHFELYLRDAGLSDRLYIVAKLAYLGYNDREIAEVLGVSPVTVGDDRHRIIKRLNLKSSGTGKGTR